MPSDDLNDSNSTPEAREGRGPDGLTEQELRRGRAEWWDDAFTALLLDAMPDGPFRLVDLGCGYGHAATTLLPAAPEAQYLGVDLDPVRAAACAELIQPLGGRARVVAGSALALPMAADCAEVVLSVSTLMHIDDVPAALSEARRVLRPGGRLVAVEPDNRVQMFRFDGSLPGLDRAFSALFARLTSLGKPAHPELGPQLPALLGAAGFDQVGFRVHMTQSAHAEPAETFLDRVSGVADVVAASAELSEQEPTLLECRQVLAQLREQLAGHEGYSVHAVPSWRCVGVA